MAAKIPDNLIDPQPRRLSELQIGETAYIWTLNMRVTDAGECFLDTQAEITTRGPGAIRVDRRVDGFHVVVIARGTKWRTLVFAKEKLVPVASIREEYDEQLDVETQLEELREVQRGAQEKITFRLDGTKKAALDRLASTLDRDRSYLLNEAVSHYLDLNQWQIDHIKQGLREAKAGKLVPEAKMKRFFRETERAARKRKGA
jgi:predicted transcriptional regulator